MDRTIDEFEKAIKWSKPDEVGLKKFLVESKGFSEAKVDSGIAKLKKSVGT